MLRHQHVCRSHYAIRVIHPIGLYTHNASGTEICTVHPIAIYTHNANSILHPLAIYTHNAIGYVINLCYFACSVSCFVRHLRYQVGPRYILIILSLEFFGVIFFNNLPPPLHFPFLPPYTCFPFLTSTRHSFSSANKSLPLRHSKITGIPRSRINISLAAICSPFSAVLPFFVYHLYD